MTTGADVAPSEFVPGTISLCASVMAGSITAAESTARQRRLKIAHTRRNRAGIFIGGLGLAETMKPTETHKPILMILIHNSALFHFQPPLLRATIPTILILNESLPPDQCCQVPFSRTAHFAHPAHRLRRLGLARARG